MVSKDEFSVLLDERGRDYGALAHELMWRVAAILLERAVGDALAAWLPSMPAPLLHLGAFLVVLVVVHDPYARPPGWGAAWEPMKRTSTFWYR